MDKVLGLGTDLVEVKRLREMLERRPNALERIFSAPEQEFANRHKDPTQRLAVRFAAKEAVMKALGVGFGAVGWKDIEIVRAESGEPSIQLKGRAAALSNKKGITNWHLTLSHTDEMAIAVALAE